jgi:hypothetical protein
MIPRLLAAGLGLLVLSACGPDERSKSNLERNKSDLERAMLGRDDDGRQRCRPGLLLLHPGAGTGCLRAVREGCRMRSAVFGASA